MDAENKGQERKRENNFKTQLEQCCLAVSPFIILSLWLVYTGTVQILDVIATNQLKKSRKKTSFCKENFHKAPHVHNCVMVQATLLCLNYTGWIPRTKDLWIEITTCRSKLYLPTPQSLALYAGSFCVYVFSRLYTSVGFYISSLHKRQGRIMLN